MKIYLAGAITGCTYEEATKWRNDVRAVLEDRNETSTNTNFWTVLDPLTGHECLVGSKHIDCFSDHLDPFMVSQKSIVTRDRFMVQQADIVLFNLSYGSNKLIGTSVELGWASAWGKSCIAVLPATSDYRHPFIQELAHCVPTLQDAMRVLYSYEH